jgi:hypothetical protein
MSDVGLAHAIEAILRQQVKDPKEMVGKTVAQVDVMLPESSSKGGLRFTDGTFAFYRAYSSEGHVRWDQTPDLSDLRDLGYITREAWRTERDRLEDRLREIVARQRREQNGRA